VSVRIKVDENLPRHVAAVLHARGHDAVTVLEQGWQGFSDGMLWRRVQDERRWLMTADKGFGDLRRYPPGSHAGVILLRSPEESRRAYLALATLALERLDLDQLAGAVVVATHRGIRVRRAPNC
jgi:predicted nuclease of predicted toxin-antitoxin system